ncbi:TlpA family protein disulfide reductase, partial [Candidatus Kaiserbacteria bacterium]|nr:TlpA family protein disulfide reductase [Candidatus Kaiserbacteria bacterium]
TILTPAQSALSVDAGGTPYTDLEGNIILLSDYIGQVIVVNSWASWSPASVTELATIANLSAEFRDNEVKFLAINRSEPANTAISFIETYKISKEITFILDHDDRFYKRIEGYNMPETVIYDREGNVFHHERGSISASKLRKLVNQALAI